MDVRVCVCVSELNVNGVTNSCAAAVMATRTSCPCLLQSEARWQALNAAMLPVTPRRICAIADIVLPLTLARLTKTASSIYRTG